MHPEILRDAPDDCPICGMALVPIAGTGGGEADDSELRDLARRLWIGIALSLPLVVLAMAPPDFSAFGVCFEPEPLTLFLLAELSA